MLNKKLFISFTVVFGLGLALDVQAVCPVCTIAVSAGVGLSRWLGVDDTITGLWLGGLTVSFITWTIDWMEKRSVQFNGRGLLTTVAYYLLIFMPLYFIGIVGHPDNTLYGIDKLLLGTVIGSGVFYAGARWYEYLKNKNGGHAYFPFQKAVMPVVPLIITSIVFYGLLQKV
jgi:hypothetical protein